MIDIPLQALANQELSIPLDGDRYIITLKEANGIMAMSITRNEVLIIENTRVVANSPVLFYDYLSDREGNFFFATQDDELPWWENFGATQFLTYATTAEIEAF